MLALFVIAFSENMFLKHRVSIVRPYKCGKLIVLGNYRNWLSNPLFSGIAVNFLSGKALKNYLKKLNFCTSPKFYVNAETMVLILGRNSVLREKCSSNIYLVKVNNRNTRIKCEICSKLRQLNIYVCSSFAFYFMKHFFCLYFASS